MSVDWEKVADFKGKLSCISANHDAPGLSNQSKEFIKKLSIKKKNGVQNEVKFMRLNSDLLCLVL